MRFPSVLFSARAEAPMRLAGLLSKSIVCAAINVLAATPLRAQAPCEQIRTACKNAGFVQGGPIGNRLVLDCFNPLVFGEQPKRASRPLPQITQQLAAACRERSLVRQSSEANAQLPPAGRSGLIAQEGGRTVHDARLAVTWLADANLAATQTFGVPNINQSGSMNYASAVLWVAAMNAFNHGAGYLGHNNWQLPTVPDVDRTCGITGRHGESFGFNCSGSALGSLYYVSLGLREPDSAVPPSQNRVGLFQNFQPYVYWSKSAAADPKQGFVSFSFNTGFQGANVFRNYLYVLPMIKGKLPGTPPGTGSHLQANPGGATVYDPIAVVTWLADANLAARETFAIAEINRDGAMDHETAIRWVAALNQADGGHGYLGQTNWDLPETGPPDPSCSMKGTTGYGCTGSAMGSLFYRQLGIRQGESVIPPSEARAGPFYNVQPYLYWACSGQSASSPCLPGGPGEGFEWNFSFGNGFQGTNLVGNALYVVVYYPESSAGQLAPNPPPSQSLPHN
jgi:hypothetical protein